MLLWMWAHVRNPYALHMAAYPFFCISDLQLITDYVFRDLWSGLPADVFKGFDHAEVW